MRVNIIQQRPVRVYRPSPGVLVADFGKEAFGRLEVIFKQPLPYAAQLAVGEVLNFDGTLNRLPGGARRYLQQTVAPEWGKGSFFMSLPRHLSPYIDYQRSKVVTPEECGGEIAPFRYAQIYNVNDDMEIEFVRHAVFAPFDDDAADFQSSDDALNQLWDFCKYTMKATSAFAVYIDGDRERQCFEGDCYINALGAYCTGGGYEVARRTIDLMLEFYPIQNIEYRLLQPVLVWDYILYSGDTQIYKYWKKSLHDNLDIVLNACNDQGLLPTPVKSFPVDFDVLIDWPVNSQDGFESGNINFAANAFLYAALQSLAKLEPENIYKQKAAELKESIRKNFFKNGIFVDCIGCKHTALHTAMWAIAFDLAEPGDLPVLSNFIRSKGMACSVYGAQFLLDAEFISGMQREAYQQLVSSGPRSWLGMLKAGATITMEAWSDEEKPNQDWNHAWGAAPATLIPRRLCGIRPLEPGFARFVVDPKADMVSEFSLRHPTIHGAIILKKSAGKYYLTVPENTCAVYKDQVLSAGEHILNI